MAEYRLHCFPESGNSYKVALMLALAGADWDGVSVDYLGGQTRDPAWRAAVNPMGEVPVLEHGGERIAQSGVALTYLAGVLGQFGGRGAAEEREVLRWLLFDNHKLTSYFATHRFMRTFAPAAPDPAVPAFLRGRIDAALAVAEAHLAAQPFVVGERPTIADLSMAGYLYYPGEETGYELERTHPGVAAWLGRLRALPGWRGPYDLLPGRRFGAQR